MPDMLAPSHVHLWITRKPCVYYDELRNRCFIVPRGEESENERLHVWVLSSAIDRDVERGIGLPVAHSQGSRPVMDQRCLNADCGSQSS